MNLLNLKFTTRSLGVASALLLSGFQAQASGHDKLLNMWSSFSQKCGSDLCSSVQNPKLHQSFFRGMDVDLGEDLRALKKLLLTEGSTPADMSALTGSKEIAEYIERNLNAEISNHDFSMIEESVEQLARLTKNNTNLNITANQYIEILDIISLILNHTDPDVRNLFSTMSDIYKEFGYQLTNEKAECVLVNFDNLNTINGKLNYLSAHLERTITAKFTSPFALDYFEDLNESIIKKYILAIEKQQTLGGKGKEIAGGVRGKQPIILTEDKSGNLLIVFTGHYGRKDDLYTFGQMFTWNNLIFGTDFDLNGDYQVLNDASYSMKKLEASLKLPEFSQYKVEKYLKAGKKVRLIAHGSQGSAAELIAYQWKKSKFKKMDQNQIQSITFGTTGYLIENSIKRNKNSFNRVMAKNNIRFRFEKDSIAPKSYYQCSNEMGTIFNIPHLEQNIVETIMDKWHSLVYYRGNLSNNGVFEPFKEQEQFYRLIKLENEVVSSLVARISNIDKKKEKSNSAYKSRILDNIEEIFENLNSLKTKLIKFDQNESLATDTSFIGRVINLSHYLSNKSDYTQKSLTSLNYLKNLFEDRLTLIQKTVGAKALAENYDDVSRAIQQLHSKISDNNSDYKSFEELISLAGQNTEAFNELANREFMSVLEDVLINREKKTNASEVRTLQGEDNERRDNYLRSVAKGKLALLLGVSPKSAGGATGSLLILDYNKKLVGVFKPKGKNGVIKSNFGQRSRLSSHPMAQSYGECASYQLSLALGLNMAPVTMMTTITLNGEKIEGAYLEFLNGYEEANKEYFENRSSYQAAEVDSFQKMVVFDWLIGNYDRHYDNFFLLDGVELEQLFCIDNANTFPTSGPNAFNGHNMYKWSELKLAKKIFTENTLKLIDSIESETINQFLSSTEKRFPGYFNSSITDFFGQRLTVLKSLIASKKPTIDSPASLATLKTREQISRALLKSK